MTDAGAARTALVIEDDEQIVDLLRFILRKEGYTVTTALDGHAARAIRSRSSADDRDPRFHAAFRDRARAPRADARASEWKTCRSSCTANSQERDAARALEAGANAYVLKPFKPEELRARVRLLVGGP